MAGSHVGIFNQAPGSFATCIGFVLLFRAVRHPGLHYSSLSASIGLTLIALLDGK